jgi:excisionase family DNA binding protein
VENGGGITKAAALFKVGRATIYRWLRREDLRATKVEHRQRKIDSEALRTILRTVFKEECDAFCKQRLRNTAEK